MSNSTRRMLPLQMSLDYRLHCKRVEPTNFERSWTQPLIQPAVADMRWVDLHSSFNQLSGTAPDSLIDSH